jgi:hypothetical protein
MRNDKGSTRTPYKVKEIEKRGKPEYELKLHKTFWKDNKMADVEFLSEKELDEFIDKWMEVYEARRIKEDKNWWYPTLNLPIALSRNKRYNIT